MADPGFPRGGTNSKNEDINLLFGQVSPKNCMKMKEFGLGAFLVPLRSATG